MIAALWPTEVQGSESLLFFADCEMAACQTFRTALLPTGMSAASSSDGAGAAHAPTPSFKAGAVLRAVAGTSKAARGVPTGNDFIFHSTTGQFGDAMDGLQARVEPLILGLLKQIHPRTTWTASVDGDFDEDDKIEALADASDILLERVDVALDQNASMPKLGAAQASASAQPAKSAWATPKKTPGRQTPGRRHKFLYVARPPLQRGQLCVSLFSPASTPRCGRACCGPASSQRPQAGAVVRGVHARVPAPAPTLFHAAPSCTPRWGCGVAVQARRQHPPAAAVVQGPGRQQIRDGVCAQAQDQAQRHRAAEAEPRAGRSRHRHPRQPGPEDADKWRRRPGEIAHVPAHAQAGPGAAPLQRAAVSAPIPPRARGTRAICTSFLQPLHPPPPPPPPLLCLLYFVRRLASFGEFCAHRAGARTPRHT